MNPRITFVWDTPTIDGLLGDAHLLQGWLLGRLSSLSTDRLGRLSEQAMAHEIVASAHIEGTELDEDAVRAELASFGSGDFNFITTGLDGEDPERVQIAGAVDVAFDSTAGCFIDMTLRRLAKWHEVLFAAGQAGTRKAEPGQYRKSRFEDAPSEELMASMEAYVTWLNAPAGDDLLLKGAISHLAGFLIRPFATGNGRIIRALSEMLLMRSDVAAATTLTSTLGDVPDTELLERLRTMGTASAVVSGLPPRFYSLSPYILEHLSAYKAEIVKVRDAVRDADPDEPYPCNITSWLVWYLEAVTASIGSCEGMQEVPEPPTPRAPAPEPASPPTAPKDATPETPAALATEAPEPPASLSELPLSARQADVLAILGSDIQDLGEAANRISTGKWAELCAVSTDTALRDITDLVKKGILVKDARRSGRSTFYRIADAILVDMLSCRKAKGSG